MNLLEQGLIFFILLGLAFSFFKRFKLWNQGQKSDQDLPWHLIFTIPKRYFVDLHKVVIRDRYIARSHILLAGPLVVIFLVLFLSAANFPIQILLDGLIVISAGLIIVGSALLCLRRFFNIGIDHSKRLSQGAFNYLPFYLIAFSLGIIGINQLDGGLVYGVALFLSYLGAFFIFYSSLLDQPFKHLISGSMHLAFHPRQKRFKNAQSVNLKKIDFQNGSGNIAVNKIADFSWNQILGFDACIECGKCQEACPAFASGQPLNPKKLIQDLLMASNGKKKYQGEDHPKMDGKKFQPNYQASEIVPKIIQEETLYSCTTCRACVESCPMMIEHVDAIVDLRRNQLLSQGNVPLNAANAIASIRYSNTLSNQSVSQRDAFLKDLEIPYLRKGEHYQVLFWIGEAGFELKNQSTIRKTIQLAKKANVNLAILENEPDVADLARRLGDEALFQDHAKTLVQTLNSFNFQSIVTCDPHAYNSLKNEYPDFGGNYQLIHHSEFLLSLIDENKLIIHQPLNQTISYHDPCYLSRYNYLVDAPRELLSRLGLEIKEMKRSKTNSRCCGWGGGAVYSDVPGKVRIPDIRIEDAKELQVQSLAVACPNCTTMLDGVVASDIEIHDIVDYVYRASY